MVDNGGFAKPTKPHHPQPEYIIPLWSPPPPPLPFPIYTDQPPKPNTAACHRKSATQTPTTTNPQIHKEAQIEKPLM